MTRRMTSPAGLDLTRDFANGYADPLATERALTAVARLMDNVGIDWAEDGTGGPEDNKHAVAGIVTDAHRICWEHAINEHGVPVRRYVARSAWEVDPDGRR